MNVFGDKNIRKKISYTEFDIILNNSNKLHIKANVTDHITSFINKRPLSRKDLEILN